jgi:NADPH2 dehydrogenase
MGVAAVCVTAGSPYYNPHLQRPAYFPPSDGYLPPNDPLVDAARMCSAAVELKKRCPSMTIVASGLSYFQEYLPHVAAGLVEAGVDSVGIGRMALSYPNLAADVIAGRELDRTHLCRTFSDCTTAPRNDMVSGCYPLDEFYKQRPERAALVQLKREVNAARRGA